MKRSYVITVATVDGLRWPAQYSCNLLNRPLPQQLGPTSGIPHVIFSPERLECVRVTDINALPFIYTHANRWLLLPVQWRRLLNKWTCVAVIAFEDFTHTQCLLKTCRPMCPPAILSLSRLSRQTWVTAIGGKRWWWTCVRSTQSRWCIGLMAICVVLQSKFKYTLEFHKHTSN